MSVPDEIAAFLKQTELHYQQALSAREKGDTESARQLIFKAADTLLRAAALSRAPLNESRKKLAEDLLAEAEELRKKKNTTPISSAPRPMNKPEGKRSTPIPADQEDQSESWLIQERPNIRFDDIAGLEDVKEQIRLKLLYPFQHPELAATYNIDPGGGILLYGPPGTGKTMIARAVAGEIDAAFFAIKPSEIMSQWVGVAEQNLQKLFAQTANYEVSVIFIDEMESLSPKRRGSNSTVMQRVVPQLLAELDGFDKRENVLLFIGATNEPWSIDNAILRPGRLDRLVYVAPPDFEARVKILTLNIDQAILDGGVDLGQIAAKTEGFSGADMAALARRVRESVFFEAIRADTQRLINMEDFMQVLREMHSSIDNKDLRKYVDFARGL